MSKITTSDWQGWINNMPIIPVGGPTIHVTGTVDTHNKDLAFLRKKVPQGTNTQILLLDLLTEMGIVPVDQPQTVHYFEQIKNADAYTSVQIFYGTKVEAEIKKISIITKNTDL